MTPDKWRFMFFFFVEATLPMMCGLSLFTVSLANFPEFSLFRLTIYITIYSVACGSFISDLKVVSLLGLGRVYFFLPGLGFGPLFLARFGSGK